MLCLHEHRKFIYTGSNIIEGTNIFLPYLTVDGAYQYKNDIRPRCQIYRIENINAESCQFGFGRNGLFQFVAGGKISVIWIELFYAYLAIHLDNIQIRKFA